MLEVLVAYYFHFAFGIGITSFQYNRVEQTHAGSKWSRVYATLVNVGTLLAMPGLIWHSVNSVKRNWFFPPLLVETYRVLLCANYAAIVYTLLSRLSRERALQQNRDRRPSSLTRRSVVAEERFSRGIFYLKFICVIYLTCSRLCSFLFSPQEIQWHGYVAMMLLTVVANILYITTFGYFYELWQMHRGFSYINKMLHVLVQQQQQQQQRSSVHKELRQLWAWHVLLTKSSLQLNRTYSVQMLAACFEYIVTSVAMGFFGCVFVISYNTPGCVIAFGAFTYLVQTFDFLLLTKMCDATVQEQRRAAQVLRECFECSNGPLEMEGEFNDFAVYLGSSKLSLCVWQLFELNSECWLKVLETVLSYMILLLQFYLMLKYK